MASKWDFVTTRAVTEERNANKNPGPSGVTHRGTSAWAGQPNSTCSVVTQSSGLAVQGDLCAGTQQASGVEERAGRAASERPMSHDIGLSPR